MKLNPEGTVVFSTFIGGSDGLNGVAVDEMGDVYVVGTDVGPSTLMGGPNTSAFWAKVTPAGDKILYQSGAFANLHACGGGSSCFLSGIQTYGIAIAADPAGNAYVAGNTYGYGLPTSPNALVTNGIGAFVAKLDPAGVPVYFTLLGSGAQPLVGLPENLLAAIAADAAGNLYIAGQTSDSNFPATASAFQPSLHGINGFVAKLNPTGTAIVWATFLGGTGRDSAKTIAVDPAGNVWTSGTTSSTDFPASSGFPSGQEFLVELNSSGSALTYSARYPANTVAAAIALDAQGVVHMAGASGLISTLTRSQSQAPHIYGLANAAGGVLTGNITPGELISIYGLHFGAPATASSFDSNGDLPTMLGGIQVTIFGLPAPLLYVSDTQINAIVPSLANSADSATSLTLTLNGASVPAVRLFVETAVPEIFQISPGYAAAINQDGTVNSESANPAKAGSYVAVLGERRSGGGWRSDGDRCLAPFLLRLRHPNISWLAIYVLLRLRARNAGSRHSGEFSSAAAAAASQPRTHGLAERQRTEKRRGIAFCDTMT